MKMKLVLCTALVGLLASPVMADLVYDVPVIIDQPGALVAGQVFTANVWAQTADPNEKYCAGWGIDVWYDAAVIAPYDDPYGNPSIMYAAPWYGVFAPPDADPGLDLAALAFPPGYDVDILTAPAQLVTLQFICIMDGTTGIFGGTTLGDPFEGFLVNPTPEPATLLLLGLGGLALIRRR